MVNKWQKSTKIVSFIVATLLGIVAIYFAMQSGKYIASPAPNGGEAPQITTPIGTMNTNLYALLLVLIALWLFVGCVLAFVTGFEVYCVQQFVDYRFLKRLFRRKVSVDGNYKVVVGVAFCLPAPVACAVVGSSLCLAKEN